MATVRQKRTAPPYAIIAFAFLWVLATTFAIIYYVQWDKAVQAQDSTQKQLSAFASEQDRNNPAVQNLLSKATRENTVVDQLLQDTHELETRIGVPPTSTVAAAVQPGGPIAGTLKAADMSGQSLLAAIQQLKGQADAATKEARQNHQALTSFRQQFASAHQSFDSDMATVNEKLQAAQTRIDQLTNTLNQAQNELNTQAASLQNQVSTQQQKYVAMLRSKVVLLQQEQQELSAEKTLVGTMRQQLVELRPPTQGSKAILARADGRVLRISSIENYVYINIGSTAHVVTGLSFAVYQPSQGVGSGPNGGGKGSLVVTDVGPYVSLARVTHLEGGQQIYPGDLIANPVYHRGLSHKFRFYVYGDFDVNGNGLATAQGRRQIVGLIRRWGGVIDKKLTSQTDFLVLGSPPSNAALNFGSSQNLQNNDLETMRKSEQNTYDQLQTEAANLSVPILNANRFLAMIGYYAHPLVKQ